MMTEMCVICVCSHIQTGLQGRRALLLLPVSNLKDVILQPSLDENKSVTSNILHRDTPTIFQHTQRKSERERATVCNRNNPLSPWLISGVHMNLNFLHMHTDTVFKEDTRFEYVRP